MQIKIVNMREFETRLKSLETAVAKKARVAALTAGAEIVRADAARRAARSARPRSIGHMADAIIIKTTINRKHETEVSIGPDKKHWYGKFAESGTRPHIIRPKVKKALAWKGGGPMAKVSHPGAPARPFLEPALDENEDAVTARIREVLHAEIMAAIGR